MENEETENRFFQAFESFCIFFENDPYIIWFFLFCVCVCVVGILKLIF